MKFKKIMLVTLLLLAVLTVSAVSASDNVTSDDLTANDDFYQESIANEANSIKDNVSSEAIGDSDEVLANSVDTNLKESNPKTFSELYDLIDDINVHYFNLTSDYKYDDSVDSQYKDGVGYADFVMDGKGHTIDGDFQATAFKFQNPVTIKNVNFVNTNGSAIFLVEIHDSYCIENCTFTNCFGNAIYVGYGIQNVSIINCTFTNCNPNQYSSNGAIYANAGITKIIGCNFIDCEPRAVYSPEGYLISKSTFINCPNAVMDGIGGGWYNKAIINSSFTNCSNAVFCAYNITNCNFINSTSEARATVYSVFNLINSTFLNCHAYNHEYATSQNGGAVEDVNNVVGCYFNNCSAYKGGAIYTSDCNISQSTFINCLAVYGGAIYISNGTIRNTQFSNNVANRGNNYYCRNNVSIINVTCTDPIVEINEVNEFISPNLSLTCIASDDNNVAEFFITANENFTANVSVSIKGWKYEKSGQLSTESYNDIISVVNGYAHFYDILNVGHYDVEVTFNGNELYNVSAVSGSVNVYQANNIISTSFFYTKTSLSDDISVTLIDYFAVQVPNATISYTINDVTTVVKLNGYESLVFSGYDEPCVIFLQYEGDEKYGPCNYTLYYTVAPDFNVEISDAIVGSPVTITITANEDINADVYIYIIKSYPSQSFTLSLVNGYGEINVTNLEEGKYTGSISYYGNENYSYYETGIQFNVIQNNPEENDEVILWINTEDEFSTDEEDLPNIFANVQVPEGMNGTVIMTYDGEEIYHLALSDFDSGRVEGNIYNIALEVDMDFIFEGLHDGDSFRFAFLDENGDEIKSQEYLIYFGENTVRFEINAHNPGDHVDISVSENIDITDEEDFVWINLPSNVTTGKVMVTSGNYTLFEEDVNFDEGTHWWTEIDGHYVCSFAPNELVNWDKLSDDDIIVFAFLDENDEFVAFKDFKVSINDNEVMFEECKHINANIWGEDDERGVLYTDCNEDVVNVDVPRGLEGTIHVLVNDEEVASWNIEFNNEEDDSSYYDWGLNDLKISEAGIYNIVVKHDDETIANQTINVVEFENDTFRVVIDYDSAKFSLYCPENSTGTVIIITKDVNENIAGDRVEEPILSDDSCKWKEWAFEDIGISEGDFHVNIMVCQDDETVFAYGKWLYWDGENDNNKLHIDIWDENDKRGTLYTDSEGNVVSINVPRDYDGAIFEIYVNNDKIATWDVEFDGEDDWAYKDWGLEELGISQAGDYEIVVVELRDGEDSEIRLNKTISVSEFGEDAFRAMILYTTEVIKFYCPENGEGIIKIITEKETEDGDLKQIFKETYEITDEYRGNWTSFALSDLGFEADGAFRVFTLTVLNATEDEVYRYRISHVDGEGGEGGDGYEEQIEFSFSSDDDEYLIFNKTSDVKVAVLYIPDTDEYADVDATVYVKLNGENFTTVRISDLKDLNVNNHYPIVLDLSGLNDKDMLTFTVEAIHMETGESAINLDENEWTLILEDKGEYFIGHDDYDPERLEFDVFRGNLTRGDTNNPELMGPKFDGKFVILTISNALNITEGTITVMDGTTEVFSKSLSQCDKEYDYGSVGYTYSINISEVLDSLPDGVNLTIAFNYENNTLMQKRIKFDDYLYLIVLPEDINNQFHFEINDDLMRESDTAIKLWTETNRQSIFIDFGGGYFTVYVNGTKVKNLGNISFNTWVNDGSWEKMIVISLIITILVKIMFILMKLHF